MQHLHHHHLQAQTLIGFFSMGVFTSFHCLGMCGPLSTLFLARANKTPAQIIPPFVYYHLCRIFSYMCIGLLLFGLGKSITFFISPKIFIGLMLIFFPVFLLSPQLPTPPILLKLLSKIMQQVEQLTPLAKSVAMGLLTPLIPCGLLYAAFGMALMSLSGYSAVMNMASFGVGTAIPMLAGQIGLTYGLGLKGGKYFSILAKVVGTLTFISSLYFFWMHAY